MLLQVKGPGRYIHQLRTLSLRSMKRLGIAAAMALLGFARPASAHPIPFSYLDLRLQRDAIEGTLIAHIYDVAHELNVQPIERLLDPAVVSAYSATIVTVLSRGLEVAADGRVLTATWSAPEIVADRQSLRLRVRFTLDHAPGTVAVAASLFPYD